MRLANSREESAVRASCEAELLNSRYPRMLEKSSAHSSGKSAR